MLGTDTYPRFMHVPGHKEGIVAKGMVGTISKLYVPGESDHLDRSDERDVVVSFTEPRNWKAHFMPEEVALVGAEPSADDASPVDDSTFLFAADIDLCELTEGAPCDRVDAFMTPIADATAFSPTMPMREAAHLLFDNKITGAPVVDNGKLVGVLTQFDFLNREVNAVQLGRESLDSGNWEVAIKKSMSKTVGGAMSMPVAVAPESDMAQVAALMLRRRFNHVPVVNPTGEILGICTSQDVLKHVLQRLDSKGD